ncbi:MAG: sugar ABC transporter permease [Chloroflexota bacterium]|nr:sugar ABC transporter permease [Chloroflexota bacterium]
MAVDLASTSSALPVASPLAGRRQRPRSRFPWVPFFLILPALLVLAAVLFYPIALAIYSSFFDIGMMNLSDQAFIGLDNYKTMVRTPAFWASARVTLIYTVGVVVGAYAVGLGAAMLLNKPFRGRAIARTMIIIPWAIPNVVTVMIWNWMLDANYGVVNYLLSVFHLIDTNLQWRAMPNLAQISVIGVTVWTTFPVALVMLLAGLQAIPRDLYEAASVDGANAWQRFRNITWPGLAPVNIVLILMLTLLAFTRVVTIIYLMTAGGPAGATETLPIQTYLQAFKFFRMGYASAIGTIVLIIAVIFSLIYMRMTARLYKQD